MSEKKNWKFQFGHDNLIDLFNRETGEVDAVISPNGILANKETIELLSAMKKRDEDIFQFAKRKAMGR